MKNQGANFARSFKELRVWQDARKQVNEVYRAFSLVRDYGFRDQIQRAAISVMNNIAEGHERSSSKEFCRFLEIAKGSNGEIRSMLYLAQDLKLLDETIMEKMMAHSQQLSKSIASLARSLK